MIDEVADPTLVFTEGAMVVVPDKLYQCWGVKLFPNRDKNGKLGVICNFLMANTIEMTSGRFPTHGEMKSASILISPADARALAKELNEFADRSENSARI
jgi:hypothetical protein